MTNELLPVTLQYAHMGKPLRVPFNAGTALKMRLDRLARVGMHICMVCLVALAALLPPVLAQAQSAHDPNAMRSYLSPQAMQELEAQAQQWAESAALANSPSDQALRLEVAVGAMDRRLHLAPCAKVEPYLPPSMRLWGRSRVGLRCADGQAKWNITLPVTVKAFGQAWVVRSQVNSGSPIRENDVIQAEVDFAEDSSNAVLLDPSTWLGQTATRSLTTGMALRQGMVKAAQVFQAGAQVRVVAQGAGFEITGQAQALSVGVVGQIARVRMDNGRIASGLVLDARTVKIDM